MLPDAPHILFVNPWVHDFAAYDVWAKPYGLLSLAAIARDHGFRVSHIDCLDRFHPRAPESNPSARHGRGPYLKMPIPKPPEFDDIARHFSRYGIKEEWLRDDLASLDRPDLIMVTTLMTYWYPGTLDTIRVIKDIFPGVPVVLGGIYPTLCEDHARDHMNADFVVTGRGESVLLDLVGDLIGFRQAPKYTLEDMDALPYPAHDLQNRMAYVPIMTSRGCPFACDYCASSFLNRTFTQRDPAGVLDEILYWHHTYGITDFVLYDDAFLIAQESHAGPILEAIVRAELNIRFHTPNALHIRGITRETAALMFKAGFTTLRLGLETACADHERRFDHKVTWDEFKRAVTCLKDAGFTQQMIGAYILAGLPHQPVASLKESLHHVKACGVTPIMAYYTPIPHTAMWEEACAVSRYDLKSDPILTNNAVFPCWPDGFSWNALSELKTLATG